MPRDEVFFLDKGQIRSNTGDLVADFIRQVPLTGYFTTAELEGKQFSSFSTEKSSVFPEKRRFNLIVSLLKINEGDMIKILKKKSRCKCKKEYQDNLELLICFLGIELRFFIKTGNWQVHRFLFNAGPNLSMLALLFQ